MTDQRRRKGGQELPDDVEDRHEQNAGMTQRSEVSGAVRRPRLRTTWMSMRLPTSLTPPSAG